MKEIEYKSKLKDLNEQDIASLSEFYHRDIKLQWSRSLLPPARPLYSPNCFVYMKSYYKAKVSIVIPHYNEVMTLLLTTITTIVYRTPPKYLYEILLIDDCSDKNEAVEIKEYADALNIPVKLLRNKERLGIADSRLYGISIAGGDVIAILDSHMEVGEGWLEPLLHIIKDKPKSIAVPSVRMMREDEEGVEWKHVITTTVMQFGYGFINHGDAYDPKDEDKHIPLMTPSLMGGALVAYKTMLEEYYPRALFSKSWGVENNRLAIRTWLCGEGIYTTGCSFVKHTNGKDFNLARYFEDVNLQVNLGDALIQESVAEILNFIPSLDEKLRLIKRSVTSEEKINAYLNTSAIIKSEFDPAHHRCPRDYEWYLNINSIQSNFNTLDHVNSDYVGEVQSVLQSYYCLETPSGHDRVTVYACRQLGLAMDDSHTIQFAKNQGVYVQDSKCFDTRGNSTSGAPLFRHYCHKPLHRHISGLNEGSQHFIYVPSSQWIKHVSSERCVDMSGLDLNDQLRLTKCDVTNAGQKWNIRMAQWF